MLWYWWMWLVGRAVSRLPEKPGGRMYITLFSRSVSAVSAAAATSLLEARATRGSVAARARRLRH